MLKMFIFAIALLIAFALGAVYFYGVMYPRVPFPTNSTWRQFTVGDHVFQVDIADTGEKRMQGLSGRDPLDPDEGMLFIFDSPGMLGFWMKDMKFDIDIIWIRDGKVIGFSQNAKAEPEKSLLQLPLYYPPERAKEVLEVNAGTVARLGIKVGDSAEFLSR
ncbi:MAG: DUF192 domain-containing protein [bacterium]|nr:DUF192 domain-containing protein [bacterium]